MEEDGQCYAESLLDEPSLCDICGEEMVFSFKDGEYHCVYCDEKDLEGL